jgi:hypothetical protein
LKSQYVHVGCNQLSLDNFTFHASKYILMQQVTVENSFVEEGFKRAHNFWRTHIGTTGTMPFEVVAKDRYEELLRSAFRSEALFVDKCHYVLQLKFDCETMLFYEIRASGDTILLPMNSHLLEYTIKVITHLQHNAQTPKKPFWPCKFCGCESQGRCAKCEVVLYCSENCRNLDSKDHETLCRHF